MASHAKAVDKGKLVHLHQARLGVHGHTTGSESLQKEPADDLVALLKQGNLKNFQAKDSGKSGSAKSAGEGGSPWRPTPRAARPGTIPDPHHARFQTFLERYCLPEFQPQWQEIEDFYRRLRDILRNSIYKGGARLERDDEMAVRDVLKYHQKSEEKISPGIDYIKIQEIYDDGTRCFWVVRVDGTEIDFSYHKCLKEKAAKECPDLVDHYDALYRGYKPELDNQRKPILI